MFGLVVTVKAIKIILLAMGVAIITIIVLETGRYISKEVRVKDLGTKKGMALLRKAKQIAVGSVTYTAKQFMKIISKAGESKEKIKGNGKTNVLEFRLPAWNKVDVDIKHIVTGHTAGGGRGDKNKDKWAAGMTAAQITKVIEEAYHNAKKMGPIQYS